MDHLRRPINVMLLCLPLLLWGCHNRLDAVGRSAAEPFVLRDSRIDKGDLFAERSGTKARALALLRESLAACEELANYRGHMCVVQRSGPRMAADENILLTLRRKPLAYLLQWTGPRDKGKQILRAKGLHGEKVVVHMGHWLPPFRPTLYLDEGSAILRQHSRFDVRQVGMEIALLATLDAIARDDRAGGSDVEIHSTGVVHKHPTTVVRYRERDVAPNGAKTFFFHIDESTKRPIMTLGYDPKDRLLFHVSYVKLEQLSPLPNSYFQPNKHW